MKIWSKFQKDKILLKLDTDSIMLSMKALSIQNADEAVAIADEIGAITNSEFPSFMKHAFNCPDERLDSIQTDREVVSDKALFLSKKRYIMHIINNEGTPCDKLKIMGVELKKSDTPIAVKNILSKLVNEILDGKTGSELLSVVDLMKRDYAKNTFREIARPISCKGLKKYQDKLDETGSDKGIPYQVRAAMFYNSMCGPSDKQIMPGDKIGVVYIKNPKSKYVAFPIDINEMPEFMGKLVVDWETQWDKTFKKIENYLSSIGMDIKSRKADIRRNLFGF